MRSDIDIAQSVTLRPIDEIARGIGLGADELLPYGRYIAKPPIGLSTGSPIGRTAGWSR